MRNCALGRDDENYFNIPNCRGSQSVRSGISVIAISTGTRMLIEAIDLSQGALQVEAGIGRLLRRD